MAILHRKEEKIQVVLGRLPKKYTDEEFVQMFIKLYSKDWGKIKSAYVKQSQDKEPGTVVNMPKPELYLKQVLEIYLSTKTVETPTTEETEVVKTKKPTSKKANPVTKKKEVSIVEKKSVKKTKSTTKKEKDISPVEEVEKKTTAKKKAAIEKPKVIKKSKSEDK